MVKKKQDKLLNYILSMLFILFLLSFLGSMLIISRFVLSDVSPIGEHVINTQNLLDDISEVGKVAISNVENQTTPSFLLSTEDLETQEITPILNQLPETKIKDFSFINVNENKTVVTLFLDRPIKQYENVFYIKLEHFSSLEKGEKILFLNKGRVWNGKFLSYDEDVDENVTDVFLELGDLIFKVPIDDVLGKVLYINFNYEEEE